MDWSRRRVIQGLMLGGAGLTGAYYSQSRRLLPSASIAVDDLGLPKSAPSKAQSLALAKYFPVLTDPDAAQGPLIVNTLEGSRSSNERIRQGAPGNAVYLDAATKRSVIPWTPLFTREQNVAQLPQSVTRKLDGAELLVLSDSSTTFPIYGNKARKYEFLLPNLQWSGIRRTATLGAVSSNHALQFALANCMADLTGSGQPLNSDLDLVLFEVPDAPIDDKRLAILQQLSQRVVVTKNMFGLAGEVAYELATQRMRSRAEAIVPPGGSNELSVLGHMNAIAEFAQFLDSSRAWDAPPDYIFVPMGSGSTVLGLVLGVQAMGWSTQVVGVADQDKSYLSRMVANQQPSLPLVEGNVAKLAHASVDWLNKIRFPGVAADAHGMLRREAFLPDSSSWGPGYGLLRASDVAWQDELGAAGLQLDPVFTLKAWRSLVAMADAGILKNKRVLFWNTYNSFDYSAFVQPVLSDLDRRHAAL